VGKFVGVPGQGMGYRDGSTIGVSKTLGAIGRKETSAEPTFMDGFQVALVVDAALQSAKSKTWQPVRREATCCNPGGAAVTNGARHHSSRGCGACAGLASGVMFAVLRLQVRALR
jgi:hypothetical protein